MRHSSYVLITPAKNEERYIRRTLQSVVEQTQLPKRWIVVSDGSTDRTDEYVCEFAARYEFIQLLRLDTSAERVFSKAAMASNAGYDAIRQMEFSFAGFLDADISLPRPYYEAVLSRFDASTRLGLAGGVIVEDRHSRFKRRHGDAGDYVPGAIQLYRRECFEQIGGFIPLRWGGADAVANVMARQKGWQVCAYPELEARHHRRTGTAGGSVHRARFVEGMQDYFLGYHPLFEAGKCFRRIPESPYLTGSMLRICGYFWPLITRRKRIVAEDFVRYLRQQQIRRIFGTVMQQEET